MAELIIRAQEPEDAAAVGRLLLQPGVFPTTLQVPYTPLATRHDSGPPSPDDHRLVAELGGRVVGSLTLRVHPRARRRHAADLGMAVDETVHGRGIGTALLAAAVDLADRWLNLHRIELTVVCHNARAIRLYRRFGFEVEGTLRDFSFNDGRYVDAYGMARLRPATTAAEAPAPAAGDGEAVR